MDKTFKELSTKTNAELKMLIFQLKSKLIEFRFKSVSGEQQQHLMRETKRLIAKIMTILTQRKDPYKPHEWQKYIDKLSDGQQVVGDQLADENLKSNFLGKLQRLIKKPETLKKE